MRNVLQTGVWILIASALVVVFALHPNFLSEVDVLAATVISIGVWVAVGLWRRPERVVNTIRAAGRIYLFWGGGLLAGSFLWAFASMTYARNTWDQVIFVVLGPAILLLVSGAVLLGIGVYKVLMRPSGQK